MEVHESEQMVYSDNDIDLSPIASSIEEVSEVDEEQKLKREEVLKEVQKKLLEKDINIIDLIREYMENGTYYQACVPLLISKGFEIGKYVETTDIVCSFLGNITTFSVQAICLCKLFSLMNKYDVKDIHVKAYNITVALKDFLGKCDRAIKYYSNNKRIYYYFLCSVIQYDYNLIGREIINNTVNGIECSNMKDYHILLLLNISKVNELRDIVYDKKDEYLHYVKEFHFDKQHKDKQYAKIGSLIELIRNIYSNEYGNELDDMEQYKNECKELITYIDVMKSNVNENVSFQRKSCLIELIELSNDLELIN